MSLWHKYRSLAPRTRLAIGFGVVAYAGVGIYLSDVAEEKFDMVPTEKDKEELRSVIPKIRLVDRDHVLSRDGS